MVTRKEEAVSSWAERLVTLPQFGIEGIDPREVGELLADAYLPTAPWRRAVDIERRMSARRQLRAIGDKLGLPPPPF